MKHFKDGLKYLGSKGKDYSVFEETYGDSINYASIDAELNIFEQYNKKAYRYALDMLEKEGKQAAQALWHNLNSLESRPGSQLPFTSVNFGLNYTFEGRCITRWCLEASMDGIGIGHAVPIFPISIFKYKKDVNDRPGTPNYDLLQLSIKSTCATIYPNYVNCDWTSNDSGAHPIRVVDNPELDKNYRVTVGIDKKLYENITLEEFFDLIESEEENRNGILIKDVRDKNITIHDITHSIFSPHVQKFKDSGISDDDLLKLPMAKIHFLSKSGDKISVTTDTFTHDYMKDSVPNKQFVYASEYLTGEQYDPDTEMATMGAIDPDHKIVYRNWGDQYTTSIEEAWKKASEESEPIVHSENSEYIETPGMYIYDSSSDDFVRVKRMTHNKDMGRWYKVYFGRDKYLFMTADHPLPTSRGRIEVQDLHIGDTVKVSNLVDSNHIDLIEITLIEFVGSRGVDEYDVETESDRFDFEFINSHNCRTMIGYDRHGMGYKKTGRGNVAPVTMILPKLGIEYGICLGERKEADIEGFFKAFDDLLDIAEKSLVDRFNYVCSQNPQAGWFMYENDSIADGSKVAKSGHIYDAMKHGTLALGYIGIANTCYAMFGKYHHEDPEVMKFADRIISTIKKRADEASERHNLNFSTYSTPKLNWAA